MAGTDVTIPADPSDGLTLSGDAGSLSIDLPFADQADDAVGEEPGVISYDNGNGSASVPVVHSDGSLQINTILESASAPRRYPYTMEGRQVTLGSGGGAIISDTTGHVIATVDPPWAKDADGHDVTTYFEVIGDSLTQVIETTSATAFPVVADPKITIGWVYGPGLYLNLTGGEMKAVAAGVVALGGGGVLLVCSGSARVPAAVAKVACTAVGSVTLWNILRAVSSIASNPKYAYNTCYQSLLASSRPWVATARGNCS